MVQYDLDFLGATVVNKLFSSPMVPWIIADVKRRKKIQKVSINIENGEIIGKTDGVTIFRHHTSNLARFYLEPNNSRVFMYLIRVSYEPVLNVYLFQAPTIEDVLEIFHAMRDSTKEQGQKSTKGQNSETTLTSLCPDISPTNSQFFEVLYVGKVKVSHRKVPETFVDEALERIRMCEFEKSKKLLKRMNDDIEKGKNWNLLKEVVNNRSAANEHTTNAAIVNSSDYYKKNLIGHVNEKSVECKNESDKYRDKPILTKASNFVIADENIVDDRKIDVIHGRTRAGSLGVIETFKRKTEDTDENRTLLFYIGQTDLRLISPDSKQVVLHKILKDIHCCLQGVKNSLHFAIIGIEVDGYVSYVFKCESEGVVEHIVSVISQSFKPLKETKEKKKQPLLSCEHCPMVWYHKLCAEVEGQHDKKTQLAIFKKIETLPEQEQTDIHTKFLRAESSDIKDQNEFLMMLLRTHCERKQSRHIHDTVETRSEFLNQVLGGNTIFMKAKRSLTNSFDHLLKRKGSQTDILNSKDSTNGKYDSNAHEPHISNITRGPADGEIIRNEISKQLTNIENLTKFHKETSNSLNANCQVSPSFEDIAVIAFNKKKIEKSILSSNETMNDLGSPKTPMINMFLKVGSSSKSPPHDNDFSDLTNQTPSRSWRQAIFNRVVTPGKVEYEEKINRRKTKNELRLLWKTAINQQILLIRMEKENARLKASQEEATVKRIKLEYDDLGNSKKEVSGLWDTLLSKDNKNSLKYNDQKLFEAVKEGIPRSKRGDVWQFLAFRNHSKQESYDFSSFSNYDIPYEKLLKQLTSFQHCILIDLGRTFPSHPYFSSSLGPGQLSLFNLLKGYSLLDPQVGYCQGLSFVAGVLLLHMSEESAFSLLKHLMFVRGLRNQYLPNMTALQVQLYQLSRLIHDTLPKLYTHFDKNEIAPTLYAASWILTLFASQFPLGFVTRVFDILFFEQTTEVLFKVIMALLEEHTVAILKISGFEEIMNYLKTKVTAMDSVCVERIMKKVLSMNISKQLHDFEIEYHVLQEEMSSPRPEIDQLRKLKIENKQLIDQNLTFKEKLEVCNKEVTRLEKCKFNQQVTINNLEAEIKNLELTARILGDFILDVSDEHKYVNVPAEIQRLIKNLESYKQNNAKVLKKPLNKTAFFKRIQSSIDFYEKPHFSELCTPVDLPIGTKYGTQTKDEKNNEKERSGNKTVLKGIPLKVIADDEDDQKILTLQQNSPKLTSKITSGVSSFFNSSPNQIIKNQKNKKVLQENSNGILPKNAEFSKQFWTTHEFSSEIGTLNIKKSDIHSHINEKIKNDPNREIKNGEVIIENVESDSSKNFFPKDTSIHFHPLDSCEGVNITYNGTTQLKSIKSGGHKLIRNATIDLIPVNSNNQFLHISENDVS